MAHEVVALADITFEEPVEVKAARRRYARAVVAGARQRGIELSEAEVIAAGIDAVTSGRVPSAAVELPGVPRPLAVVDGTTFVDDMIDFVTSSAVGAEARSTSSPTRFHWLDEWAWRPWVRRIVERVWRSPQAVCRYAWRGPRRPIQVPYEITRLLELVRDVNPSSVLELGTANGGTTYLLSRFTAAGGTIVTCDLAPRITNDAWAPGRGQHLEVLTLDTHDAASCALLHERFPTGVDVLFIDGDHRYEGVRQDLLDYGDLLRPGALLVFHDIVDDYRSRFGIDTSAWVGGVPRLWREVNDVLPAGFEAHELVEHPYQDGFGIGVIKCTDEPHPGRALLEAYASR